MSEERPEAGAWLEPAWGLWTRVDQLVRAVSTAVAVVGLALGLVYVGAHLERRSLEGRLSLGDGLEAVREASRRRVETEADGGDRG